MQLPPPLLLLLMLLMLLLLLLLRRPVRPVRLKEAERPPGFHRLWAPSMEKARQTQPPLAGLADTLGGHQLDLGPAAELGSHIESSVVEGQPKAVQHIQLTSARDGEMADGESFRACGTSLL
jgi:hypothetical protein